MVMDLYNQKMLQMMATIVYYYYIAFARKILLVYMLKA